MKFYIRRVNNYDKRYCCQFVFIKFSTTNTIDSFFIELVVFNIKLKFLHKKI